MNILSDLNEEQKRAVLHFKGPCLVLAGAGSGKTKVIAHRIAYLISSYKIPTAKILAVTFTNKSAEEMRRRVYRLIGKTISELTVKTFHSLGLKILKDFTKANFLIYDEDDQAKMLKISLKELGIPNSELEINKASERITNAKVYLYSPEEFRKTSYDKTSKLIADLYKRYQLKLEKANAYDFDDLIMAPVKLFEKSEKPLKTYQDKYEFILIDEYQDTNYAQYKLINLICKKHKNIFVVGDPDQSIYTWRGADIRNILEFEKDYPDAKVFKLEQNYRSTKRILDSASSIIKNNKFRKEKTLLTNGISGEKIDVYEAKNEKEEAGFIASKISNLNSQGFLFKDIAVLYRTHAQSRILEEKIREIGVLYKIIGGIKFYQRKEVKDILAYLKLIININDEVSIKRLKSIKKFMKFYDEIKEFASKSTIKETIENILEKTGYIENLTKKMEPNLQERIENIRELISTSEEFNDLKEFIEYVTLFINDKITYNSNSRVTLMTAHNAKGLEFPVVFITGLEEGIFPHFSSFKDDYELEEERRLCYVGITRAKIKVFISYAISRKLLGRTSISTPSRFISEIPEILKCINS